MSRDPDEESDDFRTSVDLYADATTHRDRTRRALPAQKSREQAQRQKSAAFAGENSRALDNTALQTQGRIGWLEYQGFMKPEKYRKLFLLFLTGMLALHVIVAWRSRELIRKGYPDFTALYSAGKIVGQGLRKQLYDSQTQYRIQQEFAAGVSIRQGPLPYIHPPWEALIFVPRLLAGTRTLPVSPGIASHIHPVASQKTKSAARICSRSFRSGNGLSCHDWLERGANLSLIRVACRDRDGAWCDRSRRHAQFARPAPYFSRGA